MYNSDVVEKLENSNYRKGRHAGGEKIAKKKINNTTVAIVMSVLGRLYLLPVPYTCNTDRV